MSAQKKYYVTKDLHFLLCVTAFLNMSVGFCLADSVSLIPTLTFCLIGLICSAAAFVAHKLSLFYKKEAKIEKKKTIAYRERCSIMFGGEYTKIA